MEILVLIKQVPDDSVEVKLDPATGAPNLNGVEAVVNAFDTYALEMAKRYIEDKNWDDKKNRNISFLIFRKY